MSTMRRNRFRQPASRILNLPSILQLWDSCALLTDTDSPLSFLWVVSLLASLAADDSRQQPLRSADAAFHAGYVAEKNGDLSTARQQFEKVVQLAPDIAEGHSALGSVLVQLGQYTQAIRELSRALILKADDRSAQINLAVAYEQSNDHEKSLALFRSLDRNVSESSAAERCDFLCTRPCRHPANSTLPLKRHVPLSPLLPKILPCTTLLAHLKPSDKTGIAP